MFQTLGGETVKQNMKHERFCEKQKFSCSMFNTQGNEHVNKITKSLIYNELMCFFGEHRVNMICFV